MNITVASPERTLITIVSISFFFMVGICAISVGLLLPAIRTEFDWNSATTSGFVTAYALAAMLTGPISGFLIDRFGSKFTMLLGVTVAGVGFVGMSQCTNLFQFYAAFFVMGYGYGSAFFLATTAIIATRIGEHKNMAMGIMFGVGAVGAAVSAYCINWVIDGYGWQVLTQIAGLMIFAILPVIYFCIPWHHSKDVGKAQSDEKSTNQKLPLKLVLAPYFLIITLVGGFFAFGMSGINYHVVPILTNGGLSSTTAGAVFGASWLAAGVGSVLFGAVADRFGARRVLAMALLFGVVGTMALGFVGSGPLGLIAAGLFVVCWGGGANAVTQFLPILIVNRYGVTHLGALMGLQSVLMGLSGAFAPIVTGALYDNFSNYNIAIIACTIPSFIAFLLIAIFAHRSSKVDDGFAADYEATVSTNAAKGNFS